MKEKLHDLINFKVQNRDKKCKEMEYVVNWQKLQTD